MGAVHLYSTLVYTCLLIADDWIVIILQVTQVIWHAQQAFLGTLVWFATSLMTCSVIQSDHLVKYLVAMDSDNYSECTGVLDSLSWVGEWQEHGNFMAENSEVTCNDLDEIILLCSHLLTGWLKCERIWPIGGPWVSRLTLYNIGLQSEILQIYSQKWKGLLAPWIHKESGSGALVC